jgi:hypothetical protein
MERHASRNIVTISEFAKGFTPPEVRREEEGIEESFARMRESSTAPGWQRLRRRRSQRPSAERLKSPFVSPAAIGAQSASPSRILLMRTVMRSASRGS